MPAHVADLPLIRHSERVDFKRCQTKWYWHWRKGLFPTARSFGALELGTWWHVAMQIHYTERHSVHTAFDNVTAEALAVARDNLIPEYQYEKAIELANLGMAMAKAYDAKYGDDPGINVMAAELPLEFEITDTDGTLLAVHKLKPDLVYTDENGDVWLMEHKTAASIRLEHLVIDDQARPYAAMAARALFKLGYIKRPEDFKGIMYNFARKAVPDARPTNVEGKYLNKNGSVSKSQPPAYFLRHPIVLTRADKAIALRRLQLETRKITDLTRLLRTKEVGPELLDKTPHMSCPKFCQYFTMCVTEEHGGDISEMQRSMYARQNPYTYDEDNESSDFTTSFEIG